MTAKPAIAPERSRDFLLYDLVAIAAEIIAATNSWKRLFSISPFSSPTLKQVQNYIGDSELVTSHQLLCITVSF